MTTLAAARSLLFAPGDDERKLRKAIDSRAHGVIADLEDGVTAPERARARANIERVFAGEAGAVVRAVRINPPGTPDHERDVELVRSLREPVVVLPKATPETVGAVAGLAPLIALVETAPGLASARELAGHPGVEGLALGNLDLSAELGLRPRADGLELLMPRATLVLVSAAAGIRPPFDGVRTDFRDEPGLLAEVGLAASLGLRGKLCIHPAQVEPVNDGFAPSDTDREWARAVMAESGAAAGEGRAVAVLDGTMIDAPVIARARALLEGEGTEGSTT
ncbi:MAG: citrate lyase subunit beta / citryl-CoA lyase [Thermoleophilaceae bacterium]|nr:citrate lyase subunit beta / citryl-CoA lyase [Thermoleophilaceae bacterium]